MLQYIIVIIIFLVLLNITSYILYKPPCNSIDDYFILAKKIIFTIKNSTFSNIKYNINFNLMNLFYIHKKNQLLILQKIHT